MGRVASPHAVGATAGGLSRAALVTDVPHGMTPLRATGAGMVGSRYAGDR